MPRPPDVILIVAPWLEGGGAQRALEQVLTRLPRERVHVITLFAGCRNYESVRELSGRMTELGHPRTLVGLVRASFDLRRWVRGSRTIYSLMRASHVVLGLVPSALMGSKRLAATFHQLPSAERSGLAAAAEEAMIRRALTSATLVTAPAYAAIEEIRSRKLCNVDRLVYEPNLIRARPTSSAAIRPGRLGAVRLVFAGRLTAQKGLDRLPALLAASPIPLWVRIVGDGPFEAELRERLVTISAPHRVDILPRTEDVVPVIDWSDAAFMPSRYELSPVFVWEAWQRGRGVLASNIPAFFELAQRGPVLRFTTPAEFAEGVQTIASYSYRQSAEGAGRQAVADLNHRSELVEFLAG